MLPYTRRDRMPYLGHLLSRALATAILPGSIAIGAPPAVSIAQESGSAVSAGSAASAQEAEVPPQSQDTRTTSEDYARPPMVDPLAQRIRYLHDRLRITPVQEALWAGLAQAIRDNANAMALLVKERFQVARAGTAIESLDMYEKLLESELEGLRKFKAAFQALYDKLSNGQKKIADVLFRLPQLPELPPTPPSAYQAYQPSYPAMLYPSYPWYPYFPPYSYYPYYTSLLLTPSIGLGTAILLRRYPRFHVSPPGFHPAHPSFGLVLPHSGFVPFHPALPAGAPPAARAR